jgi:hypothetical protein
MNTEYRFVVGREFTVPPETACGSQIRPGEASRSLQYKPYNDDLIPQFIVISS